MGRVVGNGNVFVSCFHSSNESQVRWHKTHVPEATFNPSQSGHWDMSNKHKPVTPQGNEEQVDRQGEGGGQGDAEHRREAGEAVVKAKSS